MAQIADWKRRHHRCANPTVFALGSPDPVKGVYQALWQQTFHWPGVAKSDTSEIGPDLSDLPDALRKTLPNLYMICIDLVGDRSSDLYLRFISL